MTSASNICVYLLTTSSSLPLHPPPKASQGSMAEVESHLVARRVKPPAKSDLDMKGLGSWTFSGILEL